MLTKEYIVVGQDRLGKIEDFVVCNSLALARQYSDGFAKVAPATAKITIYASEPIEVRAGEAKE
jgi:hypothetical protein